MELSHVSCENERAMASDRIALFDALGKGAARGDLDLLRTAVKVLAEALMEPEVTAKLGADRYDRTRERNGYRNGHRIRTWDSRAGTVELAVPKLRSGSSFPGWLLEPRHRAERALFAVVAEAYVFGVSPGRSMPSSGPSASSA